MPFECCSLFSSFFCCQCKRSCKCAVVPQDDFEDIVVIDNGSSTLRAGLARKDTPSVEFPSVTGRPQQAVEQVIDSPAFYVGKQAQKDRGILTLTYPFRDRTENSWEDMEKIWKHAFSELGVDSQNQRVLMSKAANTSTQDQKKIEEIMFEKFGVESLYLEQQGVMSMHAGGPTTGVAVNLGEGVFEAVPVYEGRAITDAVQLSGVSGKDLTDLLITKQGDNLKWEIAREIKEAECYVKTANTSSNNTPGSYTLPDGTVVTLGDELFRCTDAIFDPSAVNPNGQGIVKTTFDSIKKCKYILQWKLFKNIVVSGGNSLYNGFAKRFLKELKPLVSCCTKLNVVFDEDLNRVLVGGKKMASSPSFLTKCLTKQEYKKRMQTRKNTQEI